MGTSSAERSLVSGSFYYLYACEMVKINWIKEEEDEGEEHYCISGTYRCPPCSWVVQATVVAVLQTAGVWHTGGIVNFKPVCVVGYSTAAKLHQKKMIIHQSVAFYYHHTENLMHNK